MIASNGPLGPPPRVVEFRRGVQRLRRVYRTFFLLTFIFFVGSAFSDVLRLQNLQPTENVPRAQIQSYLVIKLLATACIAVIFVWIERHLRRERLLAQNGVVALGRVTQAIERKVRRKVSYRIAFEFAPEGGTMMQGQTQVSRKFWQEHRETGTVLEVIYDPADPKRHQLRAYFEFVEV
jgi:hypothetical protein